MGPSCAALWCQCCVVIRVQHLCHRLPSVDRSLKKARLFGEGADGITGTQVAHSAGSVPHSSQLYRDEWVRSRTGSRFTLNYTYDAAGHLASMTSSHSNGVSVSYTYDTLNRLSTVVDGRLTGNQTTTYTYDTANNVATVPTRTRCKPPSPTTAVRLQVEQDQLVA